MSLFGKSGPAASDASSADDYSGDLLPPDDGVDAEDANETGGPFDSYADTVFDPSSSMEEKKSALRQAMMTLIEEEKREGS